MDGEKSKPVRDYVTCETNDYGVRAKDQTIAVRTKTMKFIHNSWNRGKNMFFALTKDPYEKHPLGKVQDPEADKLTGWYEEWRKDYKSGNMSSPGELDSETREALKSLGYLK